MASTIEQPPPSGAPSSTELRLWLMVVKTAPASGGICTSVLSGLQYKCDDAGVWFDEVNEAYSTQTCSVCNSRTGPKGLEGLGVREWTCSECGTTHHRDRNAARNILAAGHRRLAVGIPVLPAQAAAYG